MPHIAGPEIPVLRLHTPHFGSALYHQRFDQLKKLVQCRSFTASYIIDLTEGFLVLCSSGQNVRLHAVVDKTEIPARFAVPVDIDLPSIQQCGKPFGDHRRISAIGVLPGSKHIEIPEADALEPVGAGKYIGIDLIRIGPNVVVYDS